MRTIFADFNNRDSYGYIRLNTAGSVEDLSINAVALEEGLRLRVGDGDLWADVVIHEPGAEGVWRAELLHDPIEERR